MKKKSAMLTVLAAGVLAFGFSAYENIYFEINKNIDLFGTVYKEIAANYVDEVDPGKFMRAGIDGMLGTLDPYTVYLAGKDEDEIDLMTHGQYGGVGVSIGVRDGYITVLSPMEGYSAYKQGVKTGDKIVEIDGKKVFGMNPDSVRMLVRGEPGTIVKMKIEREGESRPLDFALVREEIQVNNVSYSGMVDKQIGYIHLDRFSRRAGEEVRQAVKEMTVKGEVKGIILDLRDNPGGLLDAAVDIVGKFAPKGSTIVTTRGRKGGEEKTYTVEEEPIAAAVPLVVLVNKGSASASEIVAGAIQDLDRGVILGTRSFGKGLVQTVVPLSYDASLKITTARYYTPSGRCIQEIDYLHKNKDGIFAVTPDSLRKEFKTLHGRTVKEFGGITPDTVVQEKEPSEYFIELLRKAMFFDYATRYVVQHPVNSGDFVLTDSVVDDFQKFLKSDKFEFVNPAERKLTEVKEIMTKEHYASASLSSVDALLMQLKKENGTGFARYRDEIGRELQEEINARYNGEKGRVKLSLEHDTQVQAAASLLMNKKVYQKILTGKI
ncbi:MAG: S41 family peptidase [Bacteroidota bacterium]